MRRRPLPGSIRNPVTGRSDGYTGYIPWSRPGATIVAFESMLERDFLIVTQAYEHDVESIVCQPMRLEVPFAGSAFLWTPDFLIGRFNGVSELVEVKPLEQVFLDDEHGRDGSDPTIEVVHPRFAAMKAEAERKGFVFRLVTEAQIRVEPRLANANLLHRYAGDLFPLDWMLAGMAALEAGARDVAALRSALRADVDAPAVALRLAWLGLIVFDPGLPITRRSRFSRGPAPIAKVARR